MKRRLSICIAMIICVLLGACLNDLFAGNDSPSNWRRLEVEYAKASVELAEARLAQAQSENQAVPGSVSSGTLDELQAGVQLTQDRLKQLEAGRPVDVFTGQISAAEEEVRARQADHDESLNANRIQAGSVPELDLRREAAELAVAKARLAALRGVAQQPPAVQIQWQIGQLQDQIRALWARPLIED